jgi:hypothetical protein
MGSSQNIELVASCLTFPTPQILLESEFYNSRIVKNLRRGQTVTVQKWTVTVGQ